MNRQPRLRLLFAFVVLFAMIVGVDARAADELPAPLLVRLIHKTITFDKNFPARSQQRPRILVVHRANDDGAIGRARVLAHDLAEPNEFGRTFPVELMSYSGRDALLAALRERSASTIVFVGGLEAEMPSIATALVAKDTLTFGTNGTLAERGAVVGFDVVAGKPKLVVNVTSAQAQNVAFRAELLNLARIIR